jgi:Ca-activated chloride channel family protein
MTVLYPLWLWLLPFFALYLLYRRKTKTPPVWNLRSTLLAVSLVLLVIALARPVIPQAPVDIERRGSDVVFAVDISRSMQAADIAPNRLGAARQLLASVVQADDEDRFGVVAFTTNPIILSPLTRDDELLLHLFSGLDTSMVLTRGTHIGNALKLSRKLSRSQHPIVVLMTDGGDELGYSQEAAWAREHALIVNVVLLATAAGSTLSAGNGKLLRDEAGGIVVTTRNDAIRALADATGGVVIEGPDAAALLDAIRSQGSRDVLSKTKIVLYRELFYYPLALALLAAMLGMTDLVSRLRRFRA